MERLSMRKIREVLRLKFDFDLTDRQISNSVLVTRSTIAEYLRRFAQSGIAWPLAHQELRRQGVTLFLLWQKYKASHPDGFRYSWFCEHYRGWAGQLDAVMRQEHRAGEKCFVDYAGQTIPVIERSTGEIQQAQVQPRQQFGDSAIQFSQAEEAAVTQTRKYPAFND